MKLRDSKPLSPKRAGPPVGAKVQAVLIERLYKANSAGLSQEQRDQFRAFVTKLVEASGTSLTAKDLSQMENTARQAAERITGVVISMKKDPAPGRSSASSSSSSAAGKTERTGSISSDRVGDDAHATTSKNNVTFSASTVSGASGKLNASVGAKDYKPTPEELEAAAKLALDRTAVTVGTKREVLPEPRIFAARRKMEDLRKGFAHQVAERHVEKLRHVEVDAAFAMAQEDICKRAETVEEKQKANTKQKALENALEVRRYLGEQREYAAKQKADKLAEEDRFLRQMKEELEAEERRMQEFKEKERAAIAESIAENHKLNAIKQEMQRKAVEEEIRLQKEAARRVEEAEAAHRDKYKHIAEKQGKLADALLAATEADRAKQKAFEEATIRLADQRAEELAAKDRARAEDRKKRLAEQTTVLHGMMADRQAQKDKRRTNDVGIAAAALETAKEVEQERLDYLKRKKDDARKYGAELRDVMEERRQSKSPSRRNDPPPGFILNTKSSDLDLESAFKREMVKLLGLENKRANNSESVAPLLGFGATFHSALEDLGKTKAQEKASDVAAQVEANPLAVMKPAKVEPPSERTISIGRPKKK